MTKRRSIQAPPGGSVYVFTVFVDEVRPWGETVDATGPDTGINWKVRSVGELYPTLRASGPREVIVVHFGEKESPRPDSLRWNDEVRVWGAQQRLRPESPRAVFGVAECHPHLDQELGMEDSMALVSLEACFFEGKEQCCFSWWVRGRRGANLRSSKYGWREDALFAFTENV